RSRPLCSMHCSPYTVSVGTAGGSGRCRRTKQGLDPPPMTAWFLHTALLLLSTAMPLHTTNYSNTFIAVADDCPVHAAEVPLPKAAPTVASMQYELLHSAPY